jgi:hypothetical protein
MPYSPSAGDQSATAPATVGGEYLARAVFCIAATGCLATGKVGPDALIRKSGDLPLPLMP